MTKTTQFTKVTALALATTMLVASLGTSDSAYAHDRHQPAKHGANHYHWNKNAHRNFHRTYGRGEYGVQNYQHHLQQQNQHANQKRKSRKRARRAAIAAGIIGLAAGAIIASQSSRTRNHQNYRTYSAPTPLPSPGYVEPNQNNYENYSNNQDPNVITFNESASLEPWTQGWREWCQSRYRSFNPSKGTYRGFDGLDHFCVPK